MLWRVVVFGSWGCGRGGARRVAGWLAASAAMCWLRRARWCCWVRWFSTDRRVGVVGWVVWVGRRGRSLAVLAQYL